MSLSLKLDDKNNIIFGSNLVTISGTDSLVQDIKTELSMTKGEYPYDITQGIDYMTYLNLGDKQGLLVEILSRVLDDIRVDTCDLSSSTSGKGLLITLNTKEGKEATVELE